MNELIIYFAMFLMMFGVVGFICHRSYVYAIKQHKRLITKEIGKHLQDNAQLFKQPSTSNAVYLIGKYYDKNGTVDMEKVSKEVFELGLDRLVNK